MGDDAQRYGGRVAHPTRPPWARTFAEAVWFPAALFLGFLFCFAPALHSPGPHHAHVVVAGRAAARDVDAVLKRTQPGGFDVTAVARASDARQAVRDRTAVAGFTTGETGAPGGRGAHPVLFVAKANGASLEQALTTTFTRLVAADGSATHLTVRDVAPTVRADRMGTTLVYFGIAWSVPGYLLATTLLRATTFDRRGKLLAIAGAAALFSVVGFTVGAGLGYLPHNPVALFVAFLLTTAVATFASGLAPFTRRFFPAVGMTLFIVLSIPTSGGAAPAAMLPTFFQYVHAVIPLGNAVEALRSALYFGGAGMLRPVLVLCAWIAAGIALLGLDARRHRRTALAEAEREIQDPPTDDPSLETPTPTALPVHRHRFGEPEPDLLGTVTDPHGRPVPRALVTVLDPGGRQLVSTLTDAQGEYAATGLPEGYLSIVATLPGRQPAVQQRPLRCGAVVRADFLLRDREDAPGTGLTTAATAGR
ncbi:carboxypeptidase regulatory-like domain-containing protein [Streptomyces sp. NPDC093018]|uniref:carboxypeptidase regulatory-like domain-containing protein n=1 Tax=Streptomyces sp. NPDC093018 TaxID=3155067 RepID=UPI00341263AC